MACAEEVEVESRAKEDGDAISGVVSRETGMKIWR